MRKHTYNKSKLNIYGMVDREKIEEATKKFIKRVKMEEKKRLKEKAQHGNTNKTRAV